MQSSISYLLTPGRNTQRTEGLYGKERPGEHPRSLGHALAIATHTSLSHCSHLSAGVSG